MHFYQKPNAIMPSTLGLALFESFESLDAGFTETANRANFEKILRE